MRSQFYFKCQLEALRLFYLKTVRLKLNDQQFYKFCDQIILRINKLQINTMDPLNVSFGNEFTNPTHKSNNNNQLKYKNTDIYEENLVKLYPQNIQDHIQHHNIISKINTNTLPLTKQLMCSFNSAISVDGNLYDVLVVVLLYNYFSDRVDNIYPPKLEQWRSLIYFDYLENKMLSGESLPKQFQWIDYNTMKSCLAKMFKKLQQQTRDKTFCESDNTIFSLLTTNPILLFCMGISLRGIVQRQSEIYHIQLQSYSTMDLAKQPQTDILDLVADFFQININLFYIQNYFLRQECFKPPPGKSSKTINIIVNEHGSPKYTYLRNIIQEMPLRLQNDIRLYNSNSSAGDIKEIVDLKSIQDNYNKQCIQIRDMDVIIQDNKSFNRGGEKEENQQLQNSQNQKQKQLEIQMEIQRKKQRQIDLEMYPKIKRVQSPRQSQSKQKIQFTNTPVKHAYDVKQINGLKDLQAITVVKNAKNQSQQGKKTQRKKPKKGSYKKMKQMFQESLRQIQEKSADIFRKGQELISKVQFVSSQDMQVSSPIKTNQPYV